MEQVRREPQDVKPKSVARGCTAERLPMFQPVCSSHLCICEESCYLVFLHFAKWAINRNHSPRYPCEHLFNDPTKTDIDSGIEPVSDRADRNNKVSNNYFASRRKDWFATVRLNWLLFARYNSSAACKYNELLTVFSNFRLSLENHWRFSFRSISLRFETSSYWILL